MHSSRPTVSSQIGNVSLYSLSNQSQKLQEDITWWPQLVSVVLAAVIGRRFWNSSTSLYTNFISSFWMWSVVTPSLYTVGVVGGHPLRLPVHCGCGQWSPPPCTLWVWSVVTHSLYTVDVVGGHPVPVHCGCGWWSPRPCTLWVWSVVTPSLYPVGVVSGHLLPVHCAKVHTFSRSAALSYAGSGGSPCFFE